MAHLYASTSGVLPGPVCLLCGVELLHTDAFGMPRSYKEDPRSRRRHWKRLWKPGPEHMMVSSYEAENAYIGKFPMLWSCLYRASKPLASEFVLNYFGHLISSVIKDSDTKYRLTGINSTQSRGGPHYAVNDPTKARMSGKKNPQYHTQMFTQFYAASIERQPRAYKGKTIGYFIHAHCWALFDRVEGLGLNNANLAKLIRICRKYWRDSSWWGISADFVGPSELTLSLGYNLEVTHSPLIVPAIQQAMDSAKTECYHPSSRFSNIPLELMVLISEDVCPITDYTVNDVQNLRNMLLGFGWKLPEWFWRVRLDERLFFELGKSSESPSAYWKVRLNLMSLVADRSRLVSSGLVNRERVLGIMFALKEAYTK